ncbi:MAG: T9SS type A sorting domain-containing protein [Chitinophagaceae bacterium]|nr:T9SS type A sorting domain-containing protein [Chitinophagaceae bacterium]MCW5905306.1 T9SS type A sorting domain-containing protein [Chitinophagaceae bacterium]
MKLRLFCFFVAFLLKSNLTVSQTLEWVNNYGGTLAQKASAVTIDIDGNIIVVGYIQGSNIDFDLSPTQTSYLTSAGHNDIFVAKYTSNRDLIYAFRIGSTGNDVAMAVATDAAGSIYVSGWFRGTVDFDPSAATHNLVSNGESIGTDYGFGGDAFLVKYNTNGVYQWALNIGSAGIYDEADRLIVDNNGDILLGGSFMGSNVDFDPSVGVFALTAQGTIESFVAKYSASGALIWAKRLGGSSVVNCGVRAIRVDNANNIFVAGHFDGTIDLNPDVSASNNFTSNGCGDIYLLKLNSSGEYIWGFNVGGSNCDYSWYMDIDASNNIYVTGQFKSSDVDFNPGAGTNTLSSSGDNDIFVAKYDQNGNYVFAIKMGDTGDDGAHDIKVHGSSFYVTGRFTGTVDFNPGITTNNLISVGDADIFVAKYDLNGNYLGAFSIGSLQYDDGQHIAINGDDIILNANYSANVADIDPSTNTYSLTHSNDIDFFIAQYKWNSTLPAFLTAFTSHYTKGEKIDLIWATTTEINVAYYEVERSINGNDFEAIGKITAQNRASSNYNFADFNYNKKGNNYYRVKIVDNDSKYSYSKILQVKINDTKKIEIYPNPIVNGILSIYLNDVSSNKRINVRLINQAGQILYNNYYTQETDGKIDINVANYASGNYIVQLINEQGVVQTAQFIKP